jgi:hypothetical protein
MADALDQPANPIPEPTKALPKKNLSNPNINIPTLLEMFGMAAPAYAAYLKEKNWEDFVAFLDNLPEFPKDRVPRRKNIVYRVLKQLEVKYGTQSQSKEFAAIANSVDEILRLDAGPQGALLQNMAKACLQRITELEAASSTLNPDKRIEDSIVKYVGEIRNLMQSINTYNKEVITMREAVAKQVKEEVNLVMDSVKETVMTMFPAKVEDFQKILISKLTQYKREK